MESPEHESAAAMGLTPMQEMMIQARREMRALQEERRGETLRDVAYPGGGGPVNRENEIDRRTEAGLARLKRK